MNIIKRVMSAALCIILVFCVLYTGKHQKELEVQSVFGEGNSLVLWYTNEAMTDYLSAMAVSYHEKYGVRVIPRLQSGSDYLESVNQASLSQKDMPDLYIISNETLEKAYLCGLAGVVDEAGSSLLSEEFTDTARQAVTYHDQMVAYPYYFETSALLYNKTYLTEMAKNQLMAQESDPDDGGGDDVALTEETTESETETESANLSEEEKIAAKVDSLIPKTFDGLLTFADEYDAPAAVESVFKWDVTDIFYNYFFIGNYMDIGGKNGDQKDEINIYNQDAIDAMKVYQNLNQFFSIDADDVAYDSVIQEFMDGKIVFTTATTDIITKLEQAKKDGSFAFEYGLANVPDLNDTLKSKSLSVTNTVVINGYSEQSEKANQFARFLVFEEAASLHEKTGKMPACGRMEQTDEETKENLQVFLDEYADSVPMPKMMTTSNFWLQLEITFAEVWNGAAPYETLKDLSDLIMTQVSGEPCSAEYIIEPETIQESSEYLDEEALKEAAKEETEE